MRNRLCIIMEYFINKTHKDLLEEFYGGKGAYLKIKNIHFSTWNNTTHIESTIILGENIKDDALFTKLIELLIYDVAITFTTGRLMQSVSIDV